jgi:hydroxymethylpyrimidine pyrophosphatase-like HAD family hydrolase
MFYSIATNRLHQIYIDVPTSTMLRSRIEQGFDIATTTGRSYCTVVEARGEVHRPSTIAAEELVGEEALTISMNF